MSVQTDREPFGQLSKPPIYGRYVTDFSIPPALWFIPAGLLLAAIAWAVTLGAYNGKTHPPGVRVLLRTVSKVVGRGRAAPGPSSIPCWPRTRAGRRPLDRQHPAWPDMGGAQAGLLQALWDNLL